MRHPVAVLVPTLTLLIVLGLPFLHVRFNAPDASILPASVPVPGGLRHPREEFGEGEFAPLVLAIRTTGDATTPDNVAKLYDYSRRLEADPRVTRVVSLVDVDPRLTLAQYQLLYGVTGRAAGPVRLDGPRRDHQGRPDRVHRLHALRPEQRRGPGAGPRAPRSRRARSRRRPASTVLVGGGAADVDDVVARVWADFPRTAAVHRRVDVPRAARPAAVGRAAGQGAGHEHALDRGQLRGAGLDLPGRQPVGAARVPAARVRRDHPAGDPVLRPVRAVDGLRGLPALADEGDLGPDARQHRGGRPRASSAAAGSYLGGADRRGRRRARSRSRTSC